MSILKKMCANSFLRRATAFRLKCASNVSMTTIVDVPVLRLFSKAEGCSLCDDAKEALSSFQHMFVYEEIDITAEGNEAWYELYKYDIPVIHIDNREVMKHVVDESVLLEALQVGRK